MKNNMIALLTLSILETSSYGLHQNANVSLKIQSEIDSPSQAVIQEAKNGKFAATHISNNLNSIERAHFKFNHIQNIRPIFILNSIDYPQNFKTTFSSSNCGNFRFIGHHDFCSLGDCVEWRAPYTKTISNNEYWAFTVSEDENKIYHVSCEHYSAR